MSQLVFRSATSTTPQTPFRNLVVDLIDRPLETTNLVDQCSGWLGTQLGWLFYCQPIKNRMFHYDFFCFLPFNHRMTVGIWSSMVRPCWIVRDCRQQSWTSHPLVHVSHMHGVIFLNLIFKVHYKIYPLRIVWSLGLFSDWPFMERWSL